MASHRWLVLAFSGILAACSGDDDGGACAPSNVVDDEEDLVNTTQALSLSEQQALAVAIESLEGAPRVDSRGRTWSEAPGNTNRALARDFVESAWIDRDLELAARLAGDQGLLRRDGRRGPSLVSASASGGRERPAPDAEPTYTALRRVIAGGDLVLAVSDGEWAGTPYRFLDLLRVSDGRVVERWSSARPSRASAEPRL